jgi:hypothetical protein
MGAKIMSFKCPKDPGETAERVYMGRIQAVEAEAFLDHIQRCKKCRKVYRDSVAFVDAMRVAALLPAEDEPGSVFASSC